MDLALKLGDFGFSAEEVELILLALPTKGNVVTTLEELNAALSATSINEISNKKTTRLSSSIDVGKIDFPKSRWLRLLQHSVTATDLGESNKVDKDPSFSALLSGVVGSSLSQPGPDALLLLCDGNVLVFFITWFEPALAEQLATESATIIKEIFPFAATLYRSLRRHCYPTVFRAHKEWKRDVGKLASKISSSTVAIVCLGLSPSPELEQIVRQFNFLLQKIQWF